MLGLEAHIRRLEPETANVRHEYETLIRTLQSEARQRLRGAARAAMHA